MPDRNIFDRYLLALRKTPLGAKTEHTDRGALGDLLNVFADEADGKPHVQHEPKRITGKGAPDFKVTRRGLILGYVENKQIGENISKVLKSEQIERYKSLSQNILVTDYLDFAWITKDGTKRETLCHDTDLEDRKFKLKDERIEAVSKLLHGFFSTAPQGIGRSEQLALALAMLSRLLRDYLGQELVRQQTEHTEGRLYGLFQIFRDQVFHELTLAEFADAFAQMLAYGLFLARLNAGAKETITLQNAREHVPGSFRLIRELVDFLGELDKPEYREVRWVVEEVLSIVNGLDLPSIHEDLSFRARKAISRKVRAKDEEEHRLFERDPFIYFYEDYLKAYDKDMRKGRGVYYTPPPVVNFIVRAIDDVLKNRFGIDDGLADHKQVTALDFPRAGLAQYHGKGDHTVEAIRYSQVEQAVWINKEQCFKPVPEEVWNFHIGGYQVLDKYLKSRKGRTLTLDEIDHVAKVADSLAFTITQMKRIDAAYIAAFPVVDN